MKNKTKITVAIFLLLSCFLINVNGAKAEGFIGELDNYGWVSPINPLDSNGQAHSINTDIYTYNYVGHISGLWDIDWGILGAKDKYDKTISFTGSYLKYYVMDYRSGTDSNNNTGIYYANLGWSVDKKNPFLSNGDYELPKGPTNILTFTEGSRTIDNAIRGGESKYIKVKVNSDYSLNISKATEDDYAKYIENQYELTKKPSTYTVSSYYALTDEKILNDIYYKFYKTSEDVGNCVVPALTINTGEAILNNMNTCLYNETDNSSFKDGAEIVFVRTSKTQKYNSTYFNRLKAAMEKYSIKHWGEEEGRTKYEKAFKNLDQIMDTGEYDTRSYSDIYYKKTKAKMYDYMRNYLDDGIESSVVDNVSKNQFTNWLDLCARYVLEDGDTGVKTFKQYFDFMYADLTSYDSENDLYTKPRTSGSPLAITLDADDFTIIEQALKDMVGIKETFTSIDNFTKENCNVYCPMCIEGKNGTACTECQKGSNFKICVNCRKEAKEKCKGAPDVCVNGNFDSCLDKNLKAGAAKSYHEAVQQTYERLDNDLENLVVDLVKNLEKLDLYDFDDIIWKPANFKVNCEDYKILRYVWLFIIIGAPFLVIILGSIDFFKNVLYSRNSMELVINPRAYETEWAKNKRRFARRIIALIILIITPILIKLIINNMTPEGSGARNIKMMQCVVNGK